MGFHEWKEMDEDPFYDWRLVRKVRSLNAILESDLNFSRYDIRSRL